MCLLSNLGQIISQKKDYNPEYFGHFLIEFSSLKFRLTKLMVLHDFLCLTVINQIAFDQRDSIHFFIRVMDHCC